MNLFVKTLSAKRNKSAGSKTGAKSKSRAVKPAELPVNSWSYLVKARPDGLRDI